ncbi:MAG: dihydrofolate synthase/folylpolyglutamate synthase [Lentimonas sp.]|jgi:dihydrofolate synthase/folylpolyglutamate synthase
MQDYGRTRDYLYSLKNHGSKYGIDRMRLFAQALGQPHQQFPCIHVAGTNGKGSTCAMLEAIYRSNGYKTGLYTSPHLIRQGERVQVNRSILSEQAIIAYTERLRPMADALGANDPEDHPSFFEFMTAMAFLHFAEQAVDIALIETGLGGRLDATNVVEPELSIITSISLDHQDLLGDTLEMIASEKAGIIKAGKPVIIGRLPPEAEAVIRGVAAERGCAVHSVVEHYPDPKKLPQTNLAGSFQRWNAAVAQLASELLNDRFPVNTAKSAEALQSIQWAGRWDRIELRDRTLILDATHNPEGAVFLHENLSRLIERTGKKPIIVAGTLGEARGRKLMETIAPHAAELYLLVPDQSRATPTEFLENCLPRQRDFRVEHAKIDALFPSLGQCTIGQAGDTIVVTGSIYLIGEVMERMTCEVPLKQGLLQD